MKVYDKIQKTREEDNASTDPLSNPYLHAANSQALAMLAKTNFELSSSSEMLEKYSRAPVTGEITQVRLDSARQRYTLAFGKLSNSGLYSLENLIENYTNHGTDFLGKGALSAALYDLNRELKKGPGQLYCNVNIILIYAARVKQLGGRLSDISALQDIACTVNIFYLYILLGLYILPNREMPNEHDLNNACDAIYTHLTAEKLFKKIKEEQLNLLAIYENPSEDNLQKVIDLLTLSKNLIVKKGFRDVPTEITLTQTSLFKLVLPQIKTDPTEIARSRFVQQMDYIVRGDSTWSTNYLLEHYLKNVYKTEDFKAIENNLLNYIAIFNERIQLLNRLMITEEKPLEFCEKEELFLQDSFPIIFVYDKQDGIEDFTNEEFRSNRPLVLGVDITIVATDNKNNQEELTAYFKEKKLEIQVVLFAELYRLRKLLTEKSVNNSQISQLASTSFFNNKPATLPVSHEVSEDDNRLLPQISLIDFCKKHRGEQSKKIAFNCNSQSSQLSTINADEQKNKVTLKRLVRTLIFNIENKQGNRLTSGLNSQKVDKLSKVIEDQNFDQKSTQELIAEVRKKCKIKRNWFDLFSTPESVGEFETLLRANKLDI